MRPGLSARDYFWPIAVAGAAAIVVLIVSIVGFANQADLAAKTREEAVITAGVSSRVREVAQVVVPQAIWDEAVAKLDNHFDYQWTSDNVGVFFSETLGFSFAAVVDWEDRAVYGMLNGADTTAVEHAPFIEAARNLVQAVRRDEAERGNQAGLAEPIEAAAIKRIGERFYIVSATLVQPDFGNALIQHERAPIMIAGRELDAPFIAEFGERYQLNDARLLDGDASQQQDARALIRDENGAVVAAIEWTPQRPGAALLQRFLPWTAALLFALLLGALLLYRRAQRSAAHLVESEQRARHMAYHDAMTGIANRARVESRLVECVVESAQADRNFALHCIDLDRFKELNDVYGHETGDNLLKLVAARLRTVCGDRGECGRLGGDEFAIVQIPADLESAERLATEVVEALTQPFELSIGPTQVGCSIGVAVSSKALLEPLELLRRADLALYRAKAEGRGRVVLFEENMDAELRARRLLQADLSAAIEAQQLTMVYQPQVDRAGNIVGVESLVRWTHPQLGPLSPTVFVPLAEECGLINRLGELTLKQAFKDSLSWPSLKVAVNVSATQVRSPGFAARVIELAREVGANPGNIEIELTESVLLADDEQTHETLNVLREAGFTLALDDFGTGYSSLSYLRRFPINKIKIDRSFVNGLGEDAESEALVGAIVKLANALGLRIVAEGVENNEQWLRLMAAGCMEIQGFVASKPLSADSMTEFFDQARGSNVAEEASARPAAVSA